MRDWLTHRVRATPERTALVDAADGTAWSFADLDEAVEETAASLAGLGVGRDDHVCVLMEARPAFVQLLFAVQRLGAVLVPLNARLAVPELARQVDAADVRLLVCGRETEADAVAAADVPVVSVDDPVSPGDGSGEPPDTDDAAPVARLGTDRAAFEPAEWALDDRLALVFTSGTTGDAKAVSLSMGNVLASAGSSALRLGVLPDDRWLLCLSMYHMGGLSVPLRSARYGTTVVLHRGFDADAVCRAIETDGVTGVSLVPTMLRRLLDAGLEAHSLRFVLLGGAPARAELLERALERGVPVHPTYGMTETASQVATATPEEAATHRGTVGHPLLETDVTVVGSDGEPLPPGESGELVVAGPTVTDGYYDRPAATADAFGEYGFHTGDVGHQDDAGRLWVQNRLDDRIVTGGENVDPGEVVEALRAHPDVREVAVVGLPDDEWGERVAALVVADGDVTASSLRTFCDGRLAGFKRPRTVEFAASLPRTASGTVDRDAVRRQLRRVADV